MNGREGNVFEKINNAVLDYRLDTVLVPNDRITRLIKQLRKLKGGFNINEAISFKLGEERRNNVKDSVGIDKFAVFVTTGLGRSRLDNAIIWIYRHHFSYQELKRLVRFYRTSAGQKMANEFPFIMVESLRAVELVKEDFAALQGSKN